MIYYACTDLVKGIACVDRWLCRHKHLNIDVLLGQTYDEKDDVTENKNEKRWMTHLHQYTLNFRFIWASERWEWEIRNKHSQTFKKHTLVISVVDTAKNSFNWNINAVNETRIIPSLLTEKPNQSNHFEITKIILNK